MQTSLSTWAVGLANVLLVSALLTFAYGFFPHKAILSGLAMWETDSSSASVAPPFDRLIFMMVDALRSDFVYSNTSSFVFTQSLIRDGAAVPFTGRAGAPTITMPRVKAITTGSVPSFVDLVLNFDESDTSSTLAAQDSWLAQMRSKGSGKLIMYGDDTWLRLFPGFFDRADGTTSFFVSDFTEVDNNVTRHIPAELKHDDWSVMALHFLGLDHIGHKTGPRGPNMPAKQAEMDGIVKTIYQALESEAHLKSTLLVLLGDHGMNEGGNHGASSAGEVSTALTFISPRFRSAFRGEDCPLMTTDNYNYYDTVEQSDIAPTLAALLGFPIPKNNLGIIIPRLLQLWPKPKDQAVLLHANAKQMSEIAKGTFPAAFSYAAGTDPCSRSNTDLGNDLACEWSKISGMKDSKLAENTQQLTRFLRLAQDVLSSAASNYDVSRLYIGIATSLVAMVCSVPAFMLSSQSHGLSYFAFAAISITYSITMFASSYVEEEHQFWYWSLSGWLAILYCKIGRFDSREGLSGPVSIFLSYVLFGITRRWKQTGQKYAGDADLLSEVVTVNPWLLWALVVATYARFSLQLSNIAAKWIETKRMAVLPALITLSAFVFKVAFTAEDAPELLQNVPFLQPLESFTSNYPLVNLARLVFMGLTYIFLCSIYYEKPWKSQAHLSLFLKTVHAIFSLFLITQTRTVNIPLFLAFSFQLSCLNRGISTSTSGADVTITSLLFQFSSFFIFGGTNAISTIDLSNAYNGISGFSATFVAIFIFVSNWAGPIWWSLATCRLIVDRARPNSDTHAVGILAFDHFVQLTLFMTTATSAVMIACTVLREHLFIWTVFSPKYLYMAAWVFGQHLIVNGLCAISLGAS